MGVHPVCGIDNMPEQDDTQRSLGRIEGHLESISAKLDRSDKRMDNHAKRIRNVEKRQWGTVLAGGLVTTGFVFADKIKTLFGG